MPSRYHRQRSSVTDEALLKRVLQQNPELLYGRLYEEIYLKYEEVATAEGKGAGSLAGVKMRISRHLLDWERLLREGKQL